MMVPSVLMWPVSALTDCPASTRLTARKAAEDESQQKQLAAAFAASPVIETARKVAADAVRAQNLMAGLALGAGIAALLEMTDVRVRREEDLEDVIPLKVLVGIPHLDTPGEDRHRTLFRRLEFGVVCVIAVVMLVGNAYAFYKS